MTEVTNTLPSQEKEQVSLYQSGRRSAEQPKAAIRGRP